MNGTVAAIVADPDLKQEEKVLLVASLLAAYDEVFPGDGVFPGPLDYENLTEWAHESGYYAKAIETIAA